MARYVGDLTDPQNVNEREKAASMVNQLVRAIRNRQVRSLTLSYDRDVTDPGVLGVAAERSPWTVSLGVTRRGRHER
jgi:hypothetical protein